MTPERKLISLKEAQKPYYLGIDVGGISMKFGLVDDIGRSIHLGEVNEQGEERSFLSVKTDPSPQVSVQLMGRVISDILARHDVSAKQIAAAGLGIPSTMDMATRRLRRPPNISTWDDFPICDELQAVCGIPVYFCNDANAAAYGEYWVGSASGLHSVALLTLGTGVGTGIIIDGRTVEGAVGFGGECGHLPIDCGENARLCGCGQYGHLEAYASALAVARRTLDLATRTPSLLRETITPDISLSEIPKLVYEAAENGDALAIDIINETAHYLSCGIVAILHTINPACILLGGAMTFGGKGSAIGRMFLSNVQENVHKKTFPAIAQNLKIDLAVLGADAGFIGAAGIAREYATRPKK